MHTRSGVDIAGITLEKTHGQDKPILLHVKPEQMATNFLIYLVLLILIDLN